MLSQDEQTLAVYVTPKFLSVPQVAGSPLPLLAHVPTPVYRTEFPNPNLNSQLQFDCNCLIYEILSHRQISDRRHTTESIIQENPTPCLSQTQTRIQTGCL